MLSEKNKGILCALLISLVCYAYPLQVFVIFLFKITNTTPINIAFRAFYVGLSIFLIIVEAFKKKKRKYGYAYICLILFWVIYGIRLIYDIEFRNIIFGESSFLVYSMAFGNVLMPVLAIISMREYIVPKTLAICMFYVIILANISIFYMLAMSDTGISLNLFLERANIYINSVSVINPITIGMFGLYLSSAILPFLLFFKTKFFVKILAIFGLLLGLFNLIAGGSRGPFLFFFIFLFISLLFYLKSNKNFGIQFFKLSAIFVFFIILFLPKIISFIDSNDIAIVSRLITFSEQREAGIKEERDYSFEGAWNQFLRSPILGDCYLGELDNFYPHNIILEMFMATGIIGALFFFPFLFSVLQRLFFMGRKDNFYLLIKIWSLSGILISLSSGCLFTGIEIFILGTYALNIKN